MALKFDDSIPALQLRIKHACLGNDGPAVQAFLKDHPELADVEDEV